VSGVYPRREFNAYAERLRRRRAPTTHVEMAELRRRWETWSRIYQREDPASPRVYGHVVYPGVSRPPPWEEIEAEFAPADEAGIERVDQREERWRIPNAAFWLILEQRVKRGRLATVNGLSEMTRRNNVGFVGRTRVAKLVQWVDDHPEQAQRALALHETPAGFRATAEGVLVPPSFDLM